MDHGGGRLKEAYVLIVVVWAGVTTVLHLNQPPSQTHLLEVLEAHVSSKTSILAGLYLPDAAHCQEGT